MPTPIFVRWFAFALFLTYYYNGVLTTFHTNFIINRLEICAKDNSTKLFANVTTENGKQYLNFDVTLKHPLDETVSLIVDLQTTLDGKTYIPLFIIREKNLCKAANTFLGEMWYDIERSAQMIPGACPIAAKRYYAHHHLLDFSKMTLQTFPFGKMKAVFKAVDNHGENSGIVLCLLTEVENISN